MKPGRPRSASADLAIRRSTLELLGDVGYDRLTIESVAARACVGKTTVYRRWPTKECLVLDAMASVAGAIPTPDTGSTRDDLVTLLTALVRFVRTSAHARLVPALSAAAETNPGLASALEHFVAEKRAPMLEILRRGVARGELRADVDLELMADIVASPLFFRRMFRRRTLRPRFARELVDTALRGLEAR